MHTAATASPDSSARIETVLTARASRAQLDDRWAQMQQPDELSSPGPTRVISGPLSNGETATVVFHERQNSIEILAPMTANIEAALADLLVDLAVAPEAITWTHARIDRPAIIALSRSGVSSGVS
jgi:hypothetical protein